MLYDLAARLELSSWLLMMAVYDVRKRELPHWGTTVPLIALALGATLSWLWPHRGLDTAMDSVSIGVAFLAVVLSDSWAAVPLAGGAIGLALQGSVMVQVVVVTWLISLGFARAGIIGAGDAKLVMALITLFPDLLLAACLLGAAGVAGGIVLVRRMGSAAPALLWLTFQDLCKGRFPATTEEGALDMEMALTPALALGAMAYLWYGLLR